MDAGSHSVLGNSDLLQVIFAQIPLSELLKSTARVCQLWNRVIHNEQMNYLPFKKSFYKVVNQNHENEIAKICPGMIFEMIKESSRKAGDPFPVNGMGPLERCLPHLLNKFSCHPKLTLLNISHECLHSISNHKR